MVSTGERSAGLLREHVLALASNPATLLRAGVAAERSGLTDRLAAFVLARSRGSGRRMLLDLLLSMPLQALLIPSALSRNAVLVPVYQRVLERLGHPARLGAAVMLSLGVLG